MRARNFERLGVGEQSRRRGEVHASAKIIAAIAEPGDGLSGRFVMPGDPSKLRKRLIPV